MDTFEAISTVFDQLEARTYLLIQWPYSYAIWHVGEMILEMILDLGAFVEVNQTIYMLLTLFLREVLFHWVMSADYIL